MDGCPRHASRKWRCFGRKNLGRRPSTCVNEWSPGRSALWCVDATLIVAGAVGVVLLKSGANSKTFVVADDANDSPDS